MVSVMPNKTRSEETSKSTTENDFCEKY